MEQIASSLLRIRSLSDWPCFLIVMLCFGTTVRGDSWWVAVSVCWSMLFDLCFVRLFVAQKNRQGDRAYSFLSGQHCLPF